MPIPMWPKMEHPVGQEGPLVSSSRPLLHFLSIGTRCAHASYTIPLAMIVRTIAMLFVNRLVHTLVPGSEDEPVDTTCRTNAGFAASLICIGLNITLCLAKGIAGLLAGSVSLIADAFNNCCCTRVTYTESLTCYTIDKCLATCCSIECYVTDDDILIFLIRYTCRWIYNKLTT